MKKLYPALIFFVLMVTGCVPVHVEGSILPATAATATAESRHAVVVLTPAPVQSAMSGERSLATFLPALDATLTETQAIALWGEPDEREADFHKYRLAEGLVLWLQYDSAGKIAVAGLEAPGESFTQLHLSQPVSTDPTATPIPVEASAIVSTPTPAVLPVEGSAVTATATPVPMPAEPTAVAATPTATPVPVDGSAVIPTVELPATVLPPTAVPPAVTGRAAASSLLCTQCGAQLLHLQDGEATPLDLPVLRAGVIYDYSAQANQILYGSSFPSGGGGPATLSVTDLYVWDLASGEATAIFTDEDVVRAVWAPDGEHFVYLRAAEDTYELRWRSLAGDDKLLATDVALAFNPSPSGAQVAFTRESNYDLNVMPGVYIVNVATGEERQVSTLDKAGAGSIDDRPWWSPDETYLFLNVQRDEETQGLYRILADGTSTVKLGFDAALSEEIWYGAQSFNPLWLNPTQFVATAQVFREGTPLGGEPWVVRYQLNDSFDTVVGGTIVAEGSVLGWHVPGESVWVYAENDVDVHPLP